MVFAGIVFNKARCQKNESRIDVGLAFFIIHMNPDYDKVYIILHAIYDTYLRKYRKNPDSKQICCMWPTDDPPDVLEGTDPLLDIEKAFDICIDEDVAIELYDMTLDEAAKKIMEFMEREKAR